MDDASRHASRPTPTSTAANVMSGLRRFATLNSVATTFRFGSILRVRRSIPDSLALPRGGICGVPVRAALLVVGDVGAAPVRLPGPASAIPPASVLQGKRVFCALPGRFAWPFGFGGRSSLAGSSPPIMRAAHEKSWRCETEISMRAPMAAVALVRSRTETASGNGVDTGCDSTALPGC